MARVAEFAGIILWMYAGEHGLPHVHVQYGEFWAVVAIDTLNVLGGHVPRRKLRLATDWIDAHRAELHAFWAARNPV